MSKTAIIRIKGQVNIPGGIGETLEMLKLKTKNSCVIYEITPSIQGMLDKVKDFVTWGEIDETTQKMLIEKRGVKRIYNLNSPRKGYGRKGIRVQFKTGGALGYRKEKINDLLQRMI